LTLIITFSIANICKLNCGGCLKFYQVY
jgi:hypothetical protein